MYHVQLRQACLFLPSTFSLGHVVFDFLGTHLCHLCVDTRWLAHVLRDCLGGPTGRVDCYRWVVQWPMHPGFKGSE